MKKPKLSDYDSPHDPTGGAAYEAYRKDKALYIKQKMATNKSKQSRSLQLLNGAQKGEVFYMDVPHKTIPVYAKMYGVKVRTSTVMAIEDYTKPNPSVSKLIRVEVI